MQIQRDLPKDVIPCGTLFQSPTQPYYVVAPAFREQSAGIRLLHNLCSLLNQLGYEAYVDAPVLAGNLWTPRLTEQTKIAHYKAGKTPIVVYPEVVSGTPLGLGQPVRYVLNFPGLLGGSTTYGEDELLFVYHSGFMPEAKRLYLPLIDLSTIDAGPILPLHERTEVAYYHNRYTKNGGALRDLGPDAIEISSTVPDTHEKTLAVLKRAKLLYCYEFSGIVFEAALCGCAVIMIPNPVCLKEIPEPMREVGLEGIAWGDDAEEIARALASLPDKRRRYLEGLAPWQTELATFIEDTQSAATALAKDQAWPVEALDKLPFADLSAAELAERADRAKYTRLNAQYLRWMEHCTLREIDADIYAEYLSSGQLPGLAVLIDHRGADLDSLADTLDSLGACLGQPQALLIASDQPQPAELAGDNPIQWLLTDAQGQWSANPMPPVAADWVLVVKAGTRVAPQALMEWSLATLQWPGAELIYADDDVGTAEGERSFPNFKPDANVELLRCTNYLGSALLVGAARWHQAGAPLAGAPLYGYALDLMRRQGRAAVGHIDSILSHAPGHLDQQQENQEYLAASAVLQEGDFAHSVQPQARLGTWLVDYRVPADATVSLVVPTGLQTGYLRSLVESLKTFSQAHLHEIILVAAPDQMSEIDYALGDVLPAIPVRRVALEQEAYCHGRALNAGIAQASGQYVLVCDDDTEMLHAEWLTPLLGLAQQSDVGCVAPRLMAHRGQDARVVGGPLVLGVLGSAAPYNGEQGRLEEAGVYARLQLTQDVGAVAGHCFLFARAHWSAVGGFNEAEFGLWFSVLDFCLRLGQRGLRHAWTPQSNVLHHGRKTVDALTRDTRNRIRLADRELSEKDALLATWSQQLAHDACYNRHLSLVTPFDVESNIVIDWQPRRRERPRLLAVPLTSGAGQYRVIEPLNALQDASLAQTCAVIPERRGVNRILQPLELVRANPDRLVLQHSVDDAQLGMTDKYKLVMPGIQIVQMVDDLLGDVPAKHPNRNFQSREGHQRMIQALKQSDILVVTTEPLREHYRKYVPDVRLVPNALDKQWSGLRKPSTPRARLRVGWIGAGQHKGDLDLVTEVVRTLATEVDWVFMGMSTEEINPHLKEFHKFVSISDYPKKMSDLDLDIAIAPLEDNIFNACKSNLRLLEYGAMGWPVVCSDVFPYRADAPPVLRCENSTAAWLEALRSLIADAALRQRMGDDLHAWVNSRYRLAGLVGAWKESLMD